MQRDAIYPLVACDIQNQAALGAVQRHKKNRTMLPMLERVARHLLAFLILHKSTIRAILLLLAPLVLLLAPREYEIDTREFLYEDLDPSFRLLRSKPLKFSPRPPHETICFVLNGADSRSIVLEGAFQHIRLRSKSVLFARSDINENFFLKIYLTFDTTTAIQLHPLRNFQPCLDIIALARKHFKTELRFCPEDIPYRPSVNSIHMSLADDPLSYQKLLEFVRYCMNVERFECCNYYYIPLNDWYLRAESFYFFIIILLVSMVIETSSFSLDPLKLLLSSGLFAFFPLTSVCFLESKEFVLYATVFSALNFRAAFILCFIRYIRIVRSEMSTFSRCLSLWRANCRSEKGQ